ncbi:MULTISPECIES: FeoB-associated Cys-rich membrane protein [Sphingobacterium]|uniref:FeoB-associated Cys-rich membrane protein n=1 Tax=Sphingobacterium populi TaxID=1812824 RepID=A0ABW5U834_9SPHI
MIVQYIIIAILFIIAIVMVIKHVFPKKSTDAGCGGNCKCDAKLQKN